MPFLNNPGPLDLVIIGLGCFATIGLPLTAVAIVVYLARRRPGPPSDPPG